MVNNVVQMVSTALSAASDKWQQSEKEIEDKAKRNFQKSEQNGGTGNAVKK